MTKLKRLISVTMALMLVAPTVNIFASQVDEDINGALDIEISDSISSFDDEDINNEVVEVEVDENIDNKNDIQFTEKRKDVVVRKATVITNGALKYTVTTTADTNTSSSKGRVKISGRSSTFNDYTSYTIKDYITYNSKRYYISAIDPAVFKNQTKVTNISLNNCTKAVTLGEYGFAGMTSLKTLYMSSSKVTKIPNFLCNNDTALTTVSLPSTLTSLGISSFYGCSKLATLTNLENCTKVTSIPRSCFNRCSSLAAITLPSSISSFGTTTSTGTNDGASYTFYGCSKLETVTFKGTSLKTIPSYTFQNCTSLKTITGIDNVTAISENAFDNVGFVSFTVPSGVKTLPVNSFKNCINLTTVNIPKATENITGAFVGCTALKNILINNSNPVLRNVNGVVYMDGNDGLGHIMNLIKRPGGQTETIFTVPDGTETIADYSFESNCKLEKIILPDSVKYIGANAFANCTNLKEIVLPENLEFIGANAFANCTNIEKIEIPYNVSTLGAKLFENCKNLTYVSIPSNVTTLTTDMFTGCGYQLTVYIESGSKAEEVLSNASVTLDYFVAENVIKLNKTSLTLNSTETASLTALLRFDDDITFTTSDENIVSIVNINEKTVEILGIGPGTADIVAAVKSRADDGNDIIAKCTVTVICPVKSITLNKKSETLVVGGISQLTAKLLPIDATIKTVKWSTSNGNATVSSSGKVIAKKVGKVTITCTSNDKNGVKKTATIIIKPKKVLGLKVKSGKKKATVSFNKTTGAKKYEIYRSTKKASGFKKITATTKTKYVNKGLKKKKTYYYKVRAINGSYKGDFSTIKKVKIK